MFDEREDVLNPFMVNKLPLLTFIVICFLVVFQPKALAVEISPVLNPPYIVPDRYVSTSYGPTPHAAAEVWWEKYKQRWGVAPYGSLNCSYLLTLYGSPSGSAGDQVGGVALQGQCGGGDPVLATLECPAGYAYVGSKCTPNGDPIIKKNDPSSCTAGNPISLQLGAKYQIEEDYQDPVSSLLEFKRFYTSGGYADNQHTLKTWRIYGWRFSYSRAVDVRKTTVPHTVDVVSDNGKTVSFVSNGIEWVSDPDVEVTLTELKDTEGNASGWIVRNLNNETETYDASGRLLSISDTQGQTVTLSYIDGLLSSVADNFGRSITIATDPESKLITTLTDAAERQYFYEFDANKNLISVAYPDATPGDLSDNPRRIYHYEDTTHIHALTGISDESESRLATWSYDTQGRAISSEHANGVDSTTVDYTYMDDATDPRVTVTNALGKQTTYHFETIHGVRKPVQVEGHPAANCVGSNKSYSYDANGNLASKTDWNGVQTDYVHNARGLETSRTEAVGTPEERTVTTEWHPDFRLPVKVTTSESVTDFTYDSSGQLLSKQIIPVTE